MKIGQFYITSGKRINADDIYYFLIIV